MPAPLSPITCDQEMRDAIPVLGVWVRGTLLGLTVGLAAVFAVAMRLHPYDAASRPLRMEAHRQLGLPPCTFYTWSGGWPCPSCGMTTSFALLMHGDVWNSLRANAVGTLLASFCLLLIPWNVVCAIRGRTYFIASIERALMKIVLAFLILLLGRWLVILAIIAACGKG